MAYCAWLTERLKDKLPAGYMIRLPTEAEWETAASFDGSVERRSYPWGPDAPTLERAIYDAADLSAPVPVGCCMAGMAACGALDMAGNVWEMQASEYRVYPEGSHEPQKDLTRGQVPWRGGSWGDDEMHVRYGARDWSHVGGGDSNSGFRVMLAPALAQMS